MAQKKFLDDAGLTRVWSRVNTLLDTKEDITASISTQEIDTICGDNNSNSQEEEQQPE